MAKLKDKGLLRQTNFSDSIMQKQIAYLKGRIVKKKPKTSDKEKIFR